MPSLGWAVVVRLGQKVSDLQPEHFGKRSQILAARVAAASFPGLDVAIVDAESVADCFLCEPTC